MSIQFKLLNTLRKNTRLFQAAKLSSTTKALAGHSSIDPRLLLVGPYPKTKEEREFAARKYNLIPEDYEPYDEGERFGDYPQVPLYSLKDDDLYVDYDDVLDRHIYGLPYSKDYDLYAPVRGAVGKLPDWPLWKQGIVFFSVILVPYTIMTAIDYFDIHINHPYKMETEYGFKKQNQVHYDFPESPNSHSNHHH